MKKYPNYKPSGVEWIGDVPEGWEVKKLKRLAKICNGQDHKDVWTEEGEYPILGTGGEFGRANKFLSVGPSVILGRKGTIDKPQFVERPFWSVDTAYFTEIYDFTDPKFFFYCCTTIQFDRYKYGSAVPSMTQETLNQIPFATPPLPEQLAIAAYLDRKTAQIDQSIAEKERLIELFREERQAIINHAVTKGIRPGAKMKPSGVEWIGDVPEGWEVIPIRFVARLESGHTPSRNEPAYWENCTIPWFTLADVHQMRNLQTIFVEETSNKISELGLANSSARLLPANTVLLSRTASVGYSAIAKIPMATSQDFVNWICGEKILPLFLLFVFRAMRAEFDRLMIGSTHKTIYMPDVMAFKTPLPTIEEQKEITYYLDQKTAQIDAAVSNTQQEIALLQEYRQALIFEAVTGKICCI